MAGFPARIVISTIDSPTYQLNKFISLLLNNYLSRPKHSIKNSYEFKKLIENKKIPDGNQLISLDDVSFSTNLHSYLVISGLQKKWEYLKNHINLSRKEFLDGISILINSTYFKFNDKFYQRIIGSPMSGNFSPWFAEIALKELENSCLKSLKNFILHYSR